MRLTTEDTEGTEKRRLLVQLVAGLLASGHYTEIATYASGHPITEPRLKCHTIDWENYKKAIPPRIRPFYVIDDAEFLLNDIEFIVKQEVGNE